MKPWYKGKTEILKCIKVFEMKRLIYGLFLTNSILTLPFGFLLLIIPGAMFSSYGITLDAGGELVARGYGATLVGYGLVFYFLRNISEIGVVKSLLLAALVFNLIEAVIQTAAASKGIVLPVIWVTVVLHAIVTILSTYALINHKSK